jgi:RimJ/RimL family protein N-acetyltransferase
MSAEVTFPETIDTERLKLRRYTAAHAERILDLVDRNRSDLLRNFSSMAKDLCTVREVQSFIFQKDQEWDARKSCCYGIWLKSSQHLLGQLLVKNIVWDVPSAELSYFISGSSQRQGFATEAISEVLRQAFEKLSFNRIFVRIIPSNNESTLLAKKLGFQHEGLHRYAFRCGFGELHDVHYFSLTSKDWFSRTRQPVPIARN